MNVSYRAFGLTLQSDVEVPGLKPAKAESGAVDVRLSFGAQPDWARTALSLPATVEFTRPGSTNPPDPAFILTSFGDSEFFQLSYTDGTQFLLDCSTSRIWGACPPPLTIEDLATYFLGPVMGFVMRRRGTMALHASSVCIAGKAVAIAGESEAGKSTTAAALALRGVPVLGEDVSPLDEREGHFFVEPTYPRVCVWPDTAERLLGAPSRLPQLTPNWEKCYLDLDGALARFEPERRELGAIYFLGHREEGNQAPRVELMAPREALLDLVQNTYMNWLLDREQRAAEFKVLGRLVEQVPVRRLVPHSDPARIGELCDLILNDVSKVFDEQSPTAQVSTS